MMALRTNCWHHAAAVFIDLAIEALEISQISREKPLNNLGIDILQGAELGNYSRQENNYQISLIRLDPGVAQGAYLIGGSCQMHYAILVEVAFFIYISLG